MRIILMMTVALSMAMAEPTMVKDPKTNLIWEDTKHVSEEKVTLVEAKVYCAALKLDTFENWRVPTLSELLSLVDYARYDPAILKEFTHVDRDTLYWSSTPYTGNANSFWGVKFEDGATEDASETYNRYVRCVSAVK